MAIEPRGWWHVGCSESGDYVAAVAPSAALVLPAHEWERAQECAALLAHGGDVEDLLDVLVRDGWRKMPDFVLAVRVTDAWVVHVRGGLPLSLRAVDGSTVAYDASARPWGDVAPGPGSVVLVGASEDGAASKEPSALLHTALCRVAWLRSVPGESSVPPGTSRLEAASAQQLSAGSDTLDAWQHADDVTPPVAPPMPPAVAPDGAPALTAVGVADRTTGWVGEAAPSGPDDSASVPARLCPQGHANPVRATFCRECGQRLPDTAPTRVRRPVLVQLRLPDGRVVPVDGRVLLGRRPRAERVAGTDIPVLLALDDPNREVSGTHVEVWAEEWSVRVRDLGSTNGTVLSLSGAGGSGDRRLAPGDVEDLVPGAALLLAGTVRVAVEAVR